MLRFNWRQTCTEVFFDIFGQNDNWNSGIHEGFSTHWLICKGTAVKDQFDMNRFTVPSLYFSVTSKAPWSGPSVTKSSLSLVSSPKVVF